MTGIARAVPVARVAVAAALLALILIPAEVWDRPSTDLTATGFDGPTHYVDERGGRYVFAPFQVLTNGDWEACPCQAASYLVLAGSHPVARTFTDPEGAAELGGISVLVDGQPTRVYAVSPSQINFFLRADAKPPASTVAVMRDGQQFAHQVIAVGDPSTTDVAGATDVQIDRERLRLTAGTATQPAVHLATTPLAFRASFDVEVEQATSPEPFRVMLWNPREFASASLVFGPAPERTITAVVAEDRGNVTVERPIGTYSPGAPQRISIGFEPGDSVRFATAPAGQPSNEGEVVFTPEDAPGLLEGYRPTLTVLAQGGAESSTASLTNYALELPHDRFFTVRTTDKKIVPLMLALLGLAVVFHANLLVHVVARGSTFLRGLAGLRAPASFLTNVRVRRALAAVAIGVPFSAAVVCVMTLGSHPFDMASQTTWTYLIVSSGFEDLYYRAQTVPIAEAWGGIPFHEAVYPYGVGMSYYFLSIGWIHQLFGGDIRPDSQSLEFAIKVANLIAAVVSAALLYAIVRGFASTRLAVVAALAFLLNPAFLFDLVVWGETESVALVLLLASLFAAQRSSPHLAWALLGLAALGKPTVVLPAIIVGIYYLRLFPLRTTVEGMSIAVPAVCLVALPYVLAGYAPSIVIDPFLAVLQVFGGSETEDAFKVVSYDAYSIWPLITQFAHGEHGIARLAFPDTTTLVGPVTYQLVGLAAFATVTLLVAGWLLTSRRIGRDQSLIFLVLAFVVLAELVLPTRAIARYLVFPIVFALAGTAGRESPRAAWFVVVALTTTSLVGMYGSVATGLDANPSLAPALTPENNAVSAAALSVFRSDIVITVGALLNIAALVTLASIIWLPGREWLGVPTVVTRALKGGKRRMQAVGP